MKKKIALIVGAGVSLGSSLAKVFAEDQYIIVAVRRNSEELSLLKKQIEKNNGVCHTFSLDARNESDVIEFINKVENEIGTIDVAIYNIGANINFSIMETTSQKYHKVWRWQHLVHSLLAEKLQKK